MSDQSCPIIAELLSNDIDASLHLYQSEKPPKINISYGDHFKSDECTDTTSATSCTSDRAYDAVTELHESYWNMVAKLPGDVHDILKTDREFGAVVANLHDSCRDMDNELPSDVCELLKNDEQFPTSFKSTPAKELEAKSVLRGSYWHMDTHNHVPGELNDILQNDLEFGAAVSELRESGRCDSQTRLICEQVGVQSVNNMPSKEDAVSKLTESYWHQESHLPGDVCALLENDRQFGAAVGEVRQVSQHGSVQLPAGICDLLQNDKPSNPPSEQKVNKTSKVISGLRESYWHMDSHLANDMHDLLDIDKEFGACVSEINKTCKNVDIELPSDVRILLANDKAF